MNAKRILEIGVKEGASIRMWQEYFPEAEIHGLDMFDEFPIPDIQDDTEWLLSLYKNILNMEETAQSKGVADWLQALEAGRTRQAVYQFFIETAKKENASRQKIDIKDLIKDTGKKKLVYVMPESIGDCIISLNVLKGLENLYPDWDRYLATKPQFFQIFEPFVGDTEVINGGLIPYLPIMDNLLFWEGAGDNLGLVTMAFLPHIGTQKMLNYLHNGEDINELQ